MAAAKRFPAEVEASSNFGFLWSHVAARSASAEIRISFPASSFHLEDLELWLSAITSFSHFMT